MVNNMIISYFKRRKYLLIFLSVIFIIGFLFGIFIYYNNGINLNNIDLKNDLINNQYNNIVYHLLIISIICLISFTIIGYFGAIFYFFYEGMAISFTFSYLLNYYGFKGLILIILYNLIFKLLYLILLLLILIKLFDIIKNIIYYLFFKKSVNIFNSIKSIFIISFIIFLNDLFLFVISKIILKILINML